MYVGALLQTEKEVIMTKQDSFKRTLYDKFLKAIRMPKTEFDVIHAEEFADDIIEALPDREVWVECDITDEDGKPSQFSTTGWMKRTTIKELLNQQP